MLLLFCIRSDGVKTLLPFHVDHNYMQNNIILNVKR